MIIDEHALLELRAERDALATEIARLRALMAEMSKHRSSHIIEHYTWPTAEEYEAAAGRDFFLGPAVHYTCGIHNIAMGPHGNRCPECDRLTPPGE